MNDPRYAAEFETLIGMCHDRRVAVQTIKAVARRRWQDDASPHFSWYEPLKDEAAIRRAVHFALSRPQFFLNTSSDATILRTILRAAAQPPEAPAPGALAADVERLAMEPLFVRGVSDAI
jgi:hypothetical protein